MADPVDTRNEDWLRTTTWDLPTTIEGCEAYGVDLVALLDLPAGEAMPPDLRAYAEGLRASGDWNEEDHPRDATGKFAPKDGGDGGSYGPEITQAAAELPPITEPSARGQAVGELNRQIIAEHGDTQERHDKVDDAVGKYKAEREALHERLLNDYMARQIEDGATKGNTCIILGGLPGAGKTTSFGVIVDKADVIEIESDAFKEALARADAIPVPDGMGRLEGASLVHEESSDLSWQLANRAMGEGYNVVWDVTGGSHSQLEARIEHAQSLGYNVHGVFVDATIDKAVGNAAGRYERGLASDPDMARFTPPENIRSQVDDTGQWDSKNERIFEEAKGQYESWVKIDASGDTPSVSASSDGALGPDGKLPLD